LKHEGQDQFARAEFVADFLHGGEEDVVEGVDGDFVLTRPHPSPLPRGEGVCPHPQPFPRRGKGDALIPSPSPERGRESVPLSNGRGVRSEGVRGQPLIQQIPKYIQYIFCFVQNIAVPESDYLNSLFFLQDLSTFIIIFHLVIFVVLTSIQLYTKLCFVAVEVKYEAFLWMLAAELGVMEPTVAEDFPHELFGFGRILANFTDSFFELIREARVELDWLALTPGLSRRERE
jgi:hypothetical protein